MKSAIHQGEARDYWCWTGWPDPDPRPQDPDPPPPRPTPPPELIPQGEEIFSFETKLIRRQHGLILGRFMPPHLGHDYLIRVAKQKVAQLTVIVAERADDPIPAHTRVRWLEQMHPDVNVLPMEMDAMPSLRVAYHYWPALAESLRHTLRGTPVDCVFASAPYARALADILCASFVLVDPDRRTYPISARDIRQDPLGHWDFIPECVRPHYVRRVCLIGPEGSAKSTLTRALAERFETTFVTERARDYVAKRDQPPSVEDFELIARVQLESEQIARRSARRVLFCDTEPRMLKLWCARLHGVDLTSLSMPDYRPQEGSVYLVCAPDLPYEGRPLPGGDAARRRFFEQCIEEVDGKWPYAIIRGQGTLRTDMAATAVEQMLNIHRELSRFALDPFSAFSTLN